MTHTLAKSALLLFATSALAAGPVAAAPRAGLIPAVDRGEAPARLVLTAAHHHRHHAAAKPAADEAPEKPATYTVKKGDTLGKIADRLGVALSELKRANRIKGSAVKPGQVLKVPGAETPAKGSAKGSTKHGAHAAKAEAEAPAAPTSYKVRKGDTLEKVARKLGVSVADLRAANHLSARRKIRAGQTLKVPGAEAAEEAPPTRHGRKGAHAAPAEEAYVPERAGRNAIGEVVEVEGAPRTYKARKGDTLEKVAEKLGVSVAQLKRENHLRRSTVKRGQVFRGRGAMVKAYVVGPGDTIYSISRRFDVSVERLRAENGLGRRGSIHTGEKLRLPAGYHDRGAAAGTFHPPAYEAPPERPAAPAEQPPARPAYPPPGGSVTPPSGPAVAPTSAPPPTDAQISELGRGRFQWPLMGTIISDFGSKGAGQRNDGVNIQASTGDPVHAAAAGSVVYAGDQVPGYGNLVLINHADGWVTAYAHLSRIEVKMQQKVAQGQEIGLAGSTGGVSEPQLHFEVRYHSNPSDRAQPVDPKLVLPK